MQSRKHLVDFIGKAHEVRFLVTNIFEFKIDKYCDFKTLYKFRDMVEEAYLVSKENQQLAHNTL